MRQRKIKNLESKYENYADMIVYEPASMRGRWSELAGGRPIYLEIGCGKGKFISELAAREPEHFFVAVEGNRSVMLRALEKVRGKNLTNVAFAPEFVDVLTDWFADGEVAGIYLNFSDPLPKNYWYKRRLTYRERLKTYFRVLADDGIVTFKTDNTGLFEWSVQEIQAADLRILDITRDLHADEDADNIETEYEAKFSGIGETIKRVVIGRRVSRAEEEEMITSLAAYNGRDIPDIKEMLKASGKADVSQADMKREEEALAVSVLGGEVKSYTAAVSVNGAAGAASNAIANYSCPGDRILLADRHAKMYDFAAIQNGRSVETFELIGEDGTFNAEDFAYKVRKLLKNQEHLLIILNPQEIKDAGLSLTADDWYEVKAVLNDTDENKKIALLAECAGDKNALAVLDKLRANILPIVSDGSAIACLAYTPETAEEFRKVSTFAALFG